MSQAPILLYEGPSVRTTATKRVLFVLFAAVAVRMALVAPSVVTSMVCGLAAILLAAAARHLPDRPVRVELNDKHLVVDDPWMWKAPLKVPVDNVAGYVPDVTDRRFPQIVPSPPSGLFNLLAPAGVNRCELTIMFDVPVQFPRVGFFAELVAAVFPMMTGRMPSSVTQVPSGQVLTTTGIRIPQGDVQTGLLDAAGVRRLAAGDAVPVVESRAPMLDRWLHTFTFTAAGLVAAASSDLSAFQRAEVVAGCVTAGLAVSAVVAVIDSRTRART